MFNQNQTPSTLECILAKPRKARLLYRVLRELGYRIVLVRNREGFDVVPLSTRDPKGGSL